MSPEDIKKKRFMFLKALYDLSSASPKLCNMDEVGNLIGFDSQLADDIVDYLVKNDLIRKYKSAGKLNELIGSGKIVVLRHKGIKEVEQAKNNPQIPTEPFPAYQVIYNIGGNYVETDRVVGDVTSTLYFLACHNFSKTFNQIIQNYLSSFSIKHTIYVSMKIYQIYAIRQFDWL